VERCCRHGHTWKDTFSGHAVLTIGVAYRT
jgi:hypothetical protein